ncbi:hypothetical protein BDP27DRAFT_1426051 [Rhodocollybia butyracea]|uniref:Uncharacterized protein n=1 Tax=Rhodocollybia butyracea TaxID=206335 RepID=A0A9P5PJD3_9AGAR|nr:hypothetical protein BDP27DRAFT_1426051 [Rhodocollybia butyracea]
MKRLQGRVYRSGPVESMFYSRNLLDVLPDHFEVSAGGGWGWNTLETWRSIWNGGGYGYCYTYSGRPFQAILFIDVW